jgi:hypothetical protein
MPNYSSTHLFIRSFVVSRPQTPRPRINSEKDVTLTSFDNEFKELQRVIKEKKQAVSDADLQLKKYEHDMQALAKEKTAAVNLLRTSRSSMIRYRVSANTFCYFFFCADRLVVCLGRRDHRMTSRLLIFAG